MVSDLIGTFHVFLLFNLLVPFLVMYLTTNVMMKRPGGYGDTTLLERNPKYHKYISKKPYFYALLISFPLFLIGFLPLLWMYTPIYQWLGLQPDYTWAEL